MKPRLAFLLLALCFAPLPASAEEPVTMMSPTVDPATVRDHYQQVLARPEFHESDDLTGDFSFSDWLSQWVTHLVSEFEDFKYAGQMSGLAWLLVTTLTALAIVGLLYVLVRLARRGRQPELDQEESRAGGRTFLPPQRYDETLRHAVEARDWHAAWLATWLQFLSRLERRRLVETDRSRTNREYLAQLSAQPLPASALPLLAGLVEDYDRFVYGLRTIDEPRWLSFRRQIDEVSLLLQLRDRMPAPPAPEEAA